MPDFPTDIPYAELLLSKAYGIGVNYNKAGVNHIIEIQFMFYDKEMAHTTLYYLAYKLLKEELRFSIRNTTENDIEIIIEAPKINVKIVAKNKPHKLLDIVSGLSKGIHYDTTTVFLNCLYPKDVTKTESIWIQDSSLSENTLAGIHGSLYRQDNDGLELPSGESLFF